MGVDRLIAPVKIGSTNKRFVMKEAGGSFTSFNLTEKTYWAHRIQALDATHPSIFLAVEALINAYGSFANQYEFQIATPSSSSDLTNYGLKLVRTSGAVEFEVGFAQGTWTLPPELFGSADNVNYEPADVASLSGVLTFPLCRGGEWTLYNHYSNPCAKDKRRYPSFESYASDGNPLYAYQYDYSIGDGSADLVRDYVVEYVPGAHVFKERMQGVDHASYGTMGKLATGDCNNAFEIFWERARILRGEGTDSDFIIVHDDNTDLGAGDSVLYELARIEDIGARRAMRNFLDPMGLRGEFYKIDLRFRIKSETITAAAGAPSGRSEPALTSGATAFCAFYFDEAADTGGVVDAVVDAIGNVDDLTAAGTERPAKGATFIETDGSDDYMKGSTPGDYAFMHDATTDYMLAFTMQAKTEYSSGNHYLFGTTGNTTGFRVQVASGVLRLYTYGSSSANAAIVIPTDDSWITVMFRMDKSENDVYRYLDGVATSVANHNPGFETSTPTYALSVGRYEQDATIIESEVAIADLRIYKSLGHADDAGDYDTYADTEGLKP